MKKQTNITGKQHQQLDTAHGLIKTQRNQKRENADLLYKNFDFNKFNITNEDLSDLFRDTKYKHFQKLLKKIKEVRKAKSRTGGTRKEGIPWAMEPLKHSMNRLEN